MEQKRVGKMLNIAICDDDIQTTGEMECLIQRISKQNFVDIETEVFWNGESLVNAIIKENKFDIIYLDIEMEKEDGISAAKRIRMYDKNVLIIYVSSHENHMKDSFSVRPFQFLVKPLSEKQMEICFKAAFDDINDTDFYFRYSYKRINYKVPVRDILYFESNRRKVSIVTERDTYEVYKKLNEMSELFGVSTDYLLKDEMKAENITYHESTESYAEPLKKVTMENANEFLDMKRNGSKVVANAASMCILSPILLIVLVTMAEDSVFHVSESLATVFGCVFLLGMVAAAVFLFITYGMRESHMEHFEKECFETEYGVSGMVREKKDSYEPIFIRGTAVGVVLCILAVIPTIIAGSMEASDYYCGLSVGLLLFILAIGVNLLVRVGMVKSSYDTLLQEGEYTKEEKLFKKKTDTFSGVYWCLTTAIYLAWSFWTMSWDITWIVWPVAGVLFAALLGVVKMVLKNGSETQHYI